MARRQGGIDDGLAHWLEDEGIAPAGGPGAIADVGQVRALLVAAAREGRALSYSELLGLLGHRFTRPKMRALCRTLDAVDTAATGAGEPPLAVLVVRESDRLPGQGWWVGRSERGYAGAWTGGRRRPMSARRRRWRPVTGGRADRRVRVSRYQATGRRP